MITLSKAFFVLLCMCSAYGCKVEGRVISKEEDLELERQLKIINKPPLKTFQTDYGDIIDCIDMYKQPAFDHPLLKNHKIQLIPSSPPEVVKREVHLQAKSSVTSKSSGCPSGSIPIRRTTKESLIRERSLSKVMSPGFNPQPSANRVFSHFSVIRTHRLLYETFNGAKAYIDAYNPRVERGQTSSGQIWVERIEGADFNTMQAGWIVAPDVYGDSRSRLFTYWARDNNGKTGCYDMRCPGFVQVDHRFTLGEALTKTSTVDGDQYAIFVQIYKDVASGNWWFVAFKNNENMHVGYWPQALFSHLEHGASRVVYGGRTQFQSYQPSPPMGSGLLPGRSYYQSCFFEDIQFSTNATQRFISPSAYVFEVYNSNWKCYGVNNVGLDKEMGYTMLFGGPGGHC